jgi:predicted nucleic acid-binding protein
VITAVDTNVLLDVVLPDPVFGPRSADLLKACLSKGALIICEIVYAELACAFESQKELDSALKTLGIELQASTPEILWAAADIWKATLRRKRGRILPDFLVGAHALSQADQLLTRDRGFYGGRFRKLRILGP